MFFNGGEEDEENEFCDVGLAGCGGARGVRGDAACHAGGGREHGRKRLGECLRGNPGGGGHRGGGVSRGGGGAGHSRRGRDVFAGGGDERFRAGRAVGLRGGGGHHRRGRDEQLRPVLCELALSEVSDVHGLHAPQRQRARIGELERGGRRRRGGRHAGRLHHRGLRGFRRRRHEPIGHGPLRHPPLQGHGLGRRRRGRGHAPQHAHLRLRDLRLCHLRSHALQLHGGGHDRRFRLLRRLLQQLDTQLHFLEQSRRRRVVGHERRGGPEVRGQRRLPSARGVSGHRLRGRGLRG